MRPELIAPKPVAEFTPDEYHAYVCGMYELRKGRSSARTAPAPGLHIARSSSGALSIRRLKAHRAFDYVTMPEIAALAADKALDQADVWNLFKKKNYIIATDRLAAERLYAEQRGLPWPNKN